MFQSMSLLHHTLPLEITEQEEEPGRVFRLPTPPDTWTPQITNIVLLLRCSIRRRRRRRRRCHVVDMVVVGR